MSQNYFNFRDAKLKKKKITWVTCYDYSMAQILNESQVDCLLVGDSVAMIAHGYPSTVFATMEMMEMHTAAVSRGAPNKFIVGDLPILSNKGDLKNALENAHRLLRAGAQALKLEGTVGNEIFIKELVQAGIPVIGHLGLTPQFVNQLGGYKVQGKTENQAERILSEAQTLQEWGVSALVLECVPSGLAEKITQNLFIPTIGIGAGMQVDGQVLVVNDMLGMWKGFQAKFVRRYANETVSIQSAVNSFVSDVNAGEFPRPEESFA